MHPSSDCSVKRYFLRIYFMFDCKLLTKLSRCARNLSAVGGLSAPPFPKSAWHMLRHRTHPMGLLKWFISQRMLRQPKIFDALDWPRQRTAGCPANGMQAQALAQLIT